MKRSLLLTPCLLALASSAGLAQDVRIGGVRYERMETREQTREAMIARLMPWRVEWGEWYLLSPFPYAGHNRDDLKTPHAPEEELANMGANEAGPGLERTWEGRDGNPQRWRPLGRIDNRRVDLKVHEDEALNNNGTCYLYGTVRADAAQSIELTMGSDDGLRLWLNGALIHSKDVPRGLDPNADRLSFDLQEGVNHVLAKVSQGGGGWDFQINTRKELDPVIDAQLQYVLDQDFPPSRTRQYWNVLSLPIPQNRVVEVGGMDFLGDGRPVVSTRRGDVLIVEGAYAIPPDRLRLRPFAEGLHEPLGLAVRQDADGEALYAVQRGELTRMLDLDGDDRADLYEAFSTGWGVSGNYHEFSFGPKFDAEGNAWVSLNVGFCGSLGKSVTAYRGWALKITPTGEVIPVASGLRSPNGLGANAAGEFFYVDNQGDYVATNRLSHLAQDSWHGHPASLRWREDGGEPEPPRQAASVWFPYRKMGQSAADVTLDDTGGRFGPFAGQLFVGDQFSASVMRVDLELVEGHWQGACFPFLERLDCGVNRIEFAPDGSMFVGQTDRGWGSIGRRRYGLQRVVWGGEMPFEIQSMRATEDGFELSFTRAIDAASAADPANWRMTSYRYPYHAAYGAPETDTQPATLTPTVLDDTRVRLVVDGLRADHVHELHADGVRAANGEALLHPEAYYTLVNIPGDAR